MQILMAELSAAIVQWFPREQWVFTNYNGMPLWYLYFDNGILVTIQD